VQGRLGDWLAAFEREGLLAVAFGQQRMRMVTHINISRGDVEDALGRIQRAVGAVPV